MNHQGPLPLTFEGPEQDFRGWYGKEICCPNIKGTVITLSTGTDRPFKNSADPDQMLQNAASDQGLQCLTCIQQYFRHIRGYNT